MKIIRCTLLDLGVLILEVFVELSLFVRERADLAPLPIHSETHNAFGPAMCKPESSCRVCQVILRKSDDNHDYSQMILGTTPGASMGNVTGGDE